MPHLLRPVPGQQRESHTSCVSPGEVRGADAPTGRRFGMCPRVRGRIRQHVQAVPRLVSRFGALFIAYQRRFGGVDNLEYFRSWKRATGERVRWHEWEIDHLPGNYYLVGTDSISVT